MNNLLNIFDRAFVLAHTSIRKGETKIGQSVLLPEAEGDLSDTIKKSGARYAIFFAPEDIGIRANGGRPGAAATWQAALKGICNLQENTFLQGENIMILGAVEFGDLMAEAAGISHKTDEGLEALRKMTEVVDDRVRSISAAIFQGGAFPILIGGGHNNAYPLLAGWCDVNDEPLSVINLDPHADYRILEGRHSGNPFRYAHEDGILDKYGLVGLHEGYNSEEMIRILRKNANVLYTSFEEIFIRRLVGFDEAVNNTLDFFSAGAFGIELDLDSIPGMPVSASTPSGVSLEQARRYMHLTGARPESRYFHLPEGSAGLANENQLHELPKAIACLVADLIKSQQNG